MGKARGETSFETHQAEVNQKLFSMINRPRQGTAFAVTPKATTPDMQGKFDKCGDVMNGPIGSHYSNVTISSGTADICIGSSKYAMRVKVAPETGTTDDLVNIPGTLPGQILYLQGTANGNTLTLKSTGNINGGDFELNDTDVVQLMFDDKTTKWDIIGNSTVGSFSFPITTTIKEVTS